MSSEHKSETLDAILNEMSAESLRSLVKKLIVEFGSKASDFVSKEIGGLSETLSEEMINISDSIVEKSGPRDRSTDSGVEPKKKKARIARPFDMSKYRQRQMALQVQYEGGPYCGLAFQETDDTIEQHLFSALVKLRLIESRQSCNYSRCGRTDKGVSAYGQVVSMRLRSAFPLSFPDNRIPNHLNSSVLIDGDLATSTGIKPGLYLQEMDYVNLINKALPESIRVLGCCEVTAEFSARFSASYRQYRYFFVKRRLDVDAMSEAAKRLVGDHDFRNFCKLDIENVTNFRREIFSAEIRKVMLSIDGSDESSIYVFEVRGIAFLWHMVRCIMAVLFLVGEGKESVDIVSSLLDVTATPSKPQYTIASELPLVLHECGFDNLTIQWQPRALLNLTNHFEGLLDRHLVAAARARNALESLRSTLVRMVDVEAMVARSSSQVDFGKATDLIAWADVLALLTDASFSEDAVHVPLLKRKCHDDYETKINKLEGSKKERLNRHLELRDAGITNDPSFFSKMRQQGSLDKVK